MTTMKPTDVAEILELVNKHRSFGKKDGIKYVDFSFDNRTADVFCVTFRKGGGVEVSFHVMNEQRGLPPLKERCIEFIIGES